jgi:hypothetical protein
LEKTKKDDEEMRKRQRRINLLQKAVLAIMGVMVVYVSQNTPDPIVRTTVFILGLVIVVLAVLR